MINTFFILKNDRFFRLLEPFLNEEGIVITGIVNDPIKAQDRLPILKSDILIMDANWFLHESQTLKLLSEIVKDNPEQKIILVTTVYEPRFEKLAISCGARGYICRAAENIATIANCIRKVASGKFHFPSRNFFQTELLKTEG